jgi:hypothetical protein
MPTKTFTGPKRAHFGVKRKTLAVESRIIRSKELVWKEKARKAAEKKNDAVHAISGWTRESLHHHRKNMVAPAARIAEIAFAFLRDIPYVEVERKVYFQNFRCPSLSALVDVDEFWRDVAAEAWRWSGKRDPENEVHDEVLRWRDKHPAFTAQTNDAADLVARHGDMILHQHLYMRSQPINGGK